MTEGYAIYRATLGPRGCRRFGIELPEFKPFVTDSLNRGLVPVSILVALDDEATSPLLFAYDLDIATAELVGAINLSRLHFAEQAAWLHDGDWTDFQAEKGDARCFHCGHDFVWRSARPARVEGSTGPYRHCPSCGGTLYGNDKRVRGGA